MWSKKYPSTSTCTSIDIPPLSKKQIWSTFTKEISFS